jgi:hypothetical protein
MHGQGVITLQLRVHVHLFAHRTLRYSGGHVALGFAMKLSNGDRREFISLLRSCGAPQ